MKSKKLHIRINKPSSYIFDFVLDPKNTPLWVGSIKHEETNEWPVKLGTVYRNRGSSSNWSEYIISEFKKDKMFTMTMKDNNYHVRYTLQKAGNNSTDLEYYEWVTEGDLEEPFTLDILRRLKSIVEK